MVLSVFAGWDSFVILDAFGNGLHLGLECAGNSHSIWLEARTNLRRILETLSIFREFLNIICRLALIPYSSSGSVSLWLVLQQKLDIHLLHISPGDWFSGWIFIFSPAMKKETHVFWCHWNS
ncbi:unnamed protein product [Ilex paraguariensis]|uniref:Uncharacterized protein n=1 Tax=Ilex paraguariensis TaxID=185542 RepID=A0ABC8QM90_9AQUA